ncbi:MAG: 16S rRNA (cytidine(1402)-2'-O)-methyltransferase [Bacilli bacterium]|nr:16S rRNA (cytidine(1402)-2'-O)-methyltransferase [Bacilli bacterium]
MIQKSYDDSASLYLIPTPIGNMDDITVRSLNVLKTVDEILCEDTRDSSVLLNHFGIKKKLISCHEYNENKIVDYVINKLKEGYNLGLITDQGTPIISDPGYVLAIEVIRAGFNVISLPGATAFTPAITSSGIRPYPFLFYGFLNAKKSKQLTELRGLEKFQYTLVFYESVHRLKDTLENMLEVFGNREICVCREISKIHEEYIRGSFSEIIPLADSLKGEFVLVVEGNRNTIDYSNLDVIDHVKLYLNDMSEMEAIKKVASERGVAKSVIYQEYHNGK